MAEAIRLTGIREAAAPCPPAPEAPVAAPLPNLQAAGRNAAQAVIGQDPDPLIQAERGMAVQHLPLLPESPSLRQLPPDAGTRASPPRALPKTIVPSSPQVSPLVSAGRSAIVMTTPPSRAIRFSFPSTIKATC